MAEESSITTDRVSTFARDAARAEAALLSSMLAFRDAEAGRIGAVSESAILTLVERSAIGLDLANATGLSEHVVINRLAAGHRVREQTPTVWAAFGAGRIDLLRVMAISSAIMRLERPESIQRLDALAAEYAPRHTVAELRSRLKRFIVLVEADLAKERAEEERTHRTVSVDHGDEGMSWVTAYLPSPMAAAIESRLIREAKRQAAEADPEDDRTLAQRKGDLFGAWLTSHETTTGTIVSDIAVTLPTATLTGQQQDGFAQSADGTWVAPASWMLEPEMTDHAFWHRVITDPITDDILAHDYTGRFAPEVLTKAIAFRDGVCRAPGCTVPAGRCDIDHRTPWPTGPTTGSNLWALCRKHHAQKSHGVITWTLPSGARAPAETARTNPPPRPEPPGFPYPIDPSLN